MTRYSYLSHLECARCGHRHDATLATGLVHRVQLPVPGALRPGGLAADVAARRPARPRLGAVALPRAAARSSARDQVTLGEVVDPAAADGPLRRGLGLHEL